ncbi:uncharacterized protein LOC101847363 [Aplysia californica]|uniref:Uncharacterized protein LOC101847363 n=1 Tax=Aplysia californica TaxID=6500 RepID=A0ABM0K0E3_APLCA|nr:uncharacterized protein LOC101847363 [Aplysia californica]XP_005105810.1 uncharacterized protein LOC101847363 [Aplysia californica]
MGLTGPICAIEAGGCAAFASVSAKLAVSSEICEGIGKILHSYIQGYFSPTIHIASQLALVVRLAGLAGIFLFNALMWVLFTKSMHMCSSTLEATAFNTASNFFFTAVMGKVLLGEHLGLQWCLGSTLMVCGLILLHRGSDPAKEHQDPEVDGTQTKDKVS